MNKSDLINFIADGAGISKSKAGFAFDAVFLGIQKSLQEGEKVTLSGFGTFSPVDRPEREARNPRTGEKVVVRARKTVRFKPSKEFL